MLLPKAQVRRCLRSAAAAFPSFSEWEFVNEENSDYDGFTLWGRLAPPPEGSEETKFFVTFALNTSGWKGYLSVGMHSYYWSSADMGDAYLLDAGPCGTLDEAIMTLKRRTTNLFAALTGPDVEGLSGEA